MPSRSGTFREYMRPLPAGRHVKQAVNKVGRQASTTSGQFYLQRTHVVCAQGQQSRAVRSAMQAQLALRVRTVPHVGNVACAREVAAAKLVEAAGRNQQEQNASTRLARWARKVCSQCPPGVLPLRRCDCGFCWRKSEIAHPAVNAAMLLTHLTVMTRSVVRKASSTPSP